MKEIIIDAEYWQRGSSYVPWKNGQPAKVFNPGYLSFPNTFGDATTLYSMAGTDTDVSRTSFTYNTTTDVIYSISSGDVEQATYGTSPFWSEVINQPGGIFSQCEFFKDYVAVASSISNGSIIFIDPPGTWSSNNVTNVDVNAFLWSEDDNLYFTYEDKLGRISENVGQTFNPFNAATYSVSTNLASLNTKATLGKILDFDERYIVCTAESTASNGQSSLYFFDRTTLNFEERVILPITSISDVVVLNNTVYVLGSTLVKDGSTSSNQYVLLASNISSTVEVMDFFPLGDVQNMTVVGGEILMTVATPGLTARRAPQSYQGIWALNPKYGFYLKYQITDDNLLPLTFWDMSNAWPNGIICSFQMSSGTYHTVVLDNLSNEIAQFFNPAELETEFYQIGSFEDKKTIRRVEFYLDETLYLNLPPWDELPTIEYRLSDERLGINPWTETSWTDLVDLNNLEDSGWTGSINDAEDTYAFNCNISNVERIQFRVSKNRSEEARLVRVRILYE